MKSFSALFALAFVLPLISPPMTTAEDRPNFRIIMVDDLECRGLPGA